MRQLSTSHAAEVEELKVELQQSHAAEIDQVLSETEKAHLEEIEEMCAEMEKSSALALEDGVQQLNLSDAAELNHLRTKLEQLQEKKIAQVQSDPGNDCFVKADEVHAEVGGGASAVISNREPPAEGDFGNGIGEREREDIEDSQSSSDEEVEESFYIGEDEGFL